MEITGRVIKLLPLQTGMGKNGTWKKQEFVIETGGQIPRKICFSLWGDKIDQAGLQEGDEAEISFDLESREFKERWYTEAKAWKVVRKQGMTSIPPEDEPPMDYFGPSADDGIPF
jgi:hypothetical protein